MSTLLGLPRAAHVEPIWVRRVYMALVVFPVVFVGYVFVFLPLVFAGAVIDGCKAFADRIADRFTEFSLFELVREWRSTWSGK